LFKELNVDLREILLDITNFAQLINIASAGIRPKLNAQSFHEIILMLGYRLVQISPLSERRPTCGSENAIHLGLMAFIMTFFPGLDGMLGDMPLLYKLARSAAEDTLGNERENQEIILWVLFMGGASIFGQADDVWLVPRTVQTLQALDLHTWEDVYQTLVKLPWVSTVHDKAGETQWHKATSCIGHPIGPISERYSIKFDN
jgi:hypothetical protein